MDVAPDAWYREAVEYVYRMGLMNGMSATAFVPNGTTTRAQIHGAPGPAGDLIPVGEQGEVPQGAGAVATREMGPDL